MTKNPPHSVTDGYGNRYYTWGDNRYYSVTTLLNILSKPGIQRWAQNVVADRAVKWIDDGSIENLRAQGLERKDVVRMIADAPNDIRDDSSTAGREVHKWVERFIGEDIPPEAPEHLSSWIKEWGKFIGEYSPKFTHSEVQVFNRSRAYAGTLDAIAVIDGETWIIDIKTGKNIYGTHALQLAAYANAEFIGSEDGYDELPMPKIDRAAILHLRPRSHKLVEVDISPEVFNYFLFIQQAFMWRKIKEAEVIMDIVPFTNEEQA